MAANLELALRARAVMREAAGLGPEQFADEDLVRMLSDEIQALRDRGSSDDEISRMAKDRAGLELSSQSIQRYMESNGDEKRVG